MHRLRFHLITALQVVAFMGVGLTLGLGLIWAIFTFITSQAY